MYGVTKCSSRDCQFIEEFFLYQCIRRLINRRGAVRQLRSDQGTNFIGARSEMKAALCEMNQDHVQDYFLRNECAWIPFKLNVPHSCHMGGTWERMIWSVRNAVREPLLLQAGSQLDDETLPTLLTEVKFIINSRPLSVDNLCDAEAPEPLTPNQSGQTCRSSSNLQLNKRHVVN